MLDKIVNLSFSPRPFIGHLLSNGMVTDPLLLEKTVFVCESEMKQAFITALYFKACRICHLSLLLWMP